MFLPAFITAPLDFQCIMFFLQPPLSPRTNLNHPEPSTQEWYFPTNSSKRMAFPLHNTFLLCYPEIPVFPLTCYWFQKILINLHQRLIPLSNAAISSSFLVHFRVIVSLVWQFSHQKNKPYFLVISIFPLPSLWGQSLNVSDLSWFWW